jgi:hypothetical protein
MRGAPTTTTEGPLTLDSQLAPLPSLADMGLDLPSTGLQAEAGLGGLSTPMRRTVESSEAASLLLSPGYEDGAAVCSLCVEKFEILAVGGCNHGVCHRCALRMRVLDNNRDCPVCRTRLDKVGLCSSGGASEPRGERKRGRGAPGIQSGRRKRGCGTPGALFAHPPRRP